MRQIGKEATTKGVLNKKSRDVIDKETSIKSYL